MVIQVRFIKALIKEIIDDLNKEASAYVLRGVEPRDISQAVSEAAIAGGPEVNPLSV
jgi:hypothetical protein